MNNKEIIQKCYAGKIDKKELLKLGGTVGFIDILNDVINETRKDVLNDLIWYFETEKYDSERSAEQEDQANSGSCFRAMGFSCRARTLKDVIMKLEEELKSNNGI